MIRRSPTHELIRRLCASALCLGSGTLPTAANLIINPIYVDDFGQSWDATRRAVVDQAISEWTSSLGAPGGQTYELDISFSFADTATRDSLGHWRGGSDGLFVGFDFLPWQYSSHLIRFISDLIDTGLDNYIWWDPTPDDTGLDQPFEAWDALSIARHEIGHALGYTTLYSYYISLPSEIKPWESLITDVAGTPTFDAGGINVEMASSSDYAHVANSGISQDDLMNPAISNSQRRDISQINISMLSMAYGYEVIPEPSVGMLAMGSGLLLLRRRRSS